MNSGNQYPTLFEARLISHKDDPDTSCRAAREMVRSGKLSRQENQVYIVIVQQFRDRDFTARNLAFDTGLDYYTIQRRLSGLKRKGYVKRIIIGYTADEKPIYKKRGGCCVWKLIKEK